MTDIENNNNSSTRVISSHNERPNKATNTGKSKSEQFYIANSRSLKALAVFCEGLQDDDGKLFVNLSILPWSSARKASNVQLSANNLRAEVLRRFSTESSDDSLSPCPNDVSLDLCPNNEFLVPRPNKWTTSRACSWLLQHPITG